MGPMDMKDAKKEAPPQVYLSLFLPASNKIKRLQCNQLPKVRLGT